MNRGILLIVICTCSVFAFAQRKDLTLNGKVAKVTTIEYQAESAFGRTSRGIEKYREIKTYTPYGFLLQREKIENGIVIYKDVCQTNEIGNKKILSECYKNGILAGVFEYDDNNNIRKYEIYKEGKLDRVCFYGYNEYGCVSDTVYGSDGALKSLTIHTYVDSLETKSILYKSNGDFLSGRQMFYDEKGKLTYVLDSASYQQASNITKYTYDESGNKIEISRVQPDLSIYTKTTKAYNKYGDVISSHIETKGKTESMVTTNYQLEYDEYGNWIKKVDFKVQGIIEIPTIWSERIIEYYE